MAELNVPRLIELLTPLAATQFDRRTLLAEAKFGMRILEQVAYEGTPQEFLIRLLPQLESALPDSSGKPPLQKLLEAGKKLASSDAAAFDELLAALPAPAVQPAVPPASLPDTQPAVPMVRSVTKLLPAPFEWCSIPGGIVQLEPPFPNDGLPPKQTIAPFFISKYLITQPQYALFVKEQDGYRNSQWWDFSPEAQQWRAAFPIPVVPTHQGEDIPATEVTWFAAMAFCRWLRVRSGQAISLPTEAQWQRAAQGDDGRSFPWGMEFDALRCNTKEGGIRRPTAVNRHLQGSSPYGVLDMAGNLAEYTQTPQIRFDRENQRVFPYVVARGGSWNTNQVMARCAARLNQVGLDEATDTLGFRIVLNDT